VDYSRNNPSASTNIQVRALKYSFPGVRIYSTEEKTILLAVEDTKSLKFLIHRSLRPQVSE